jgi:hypothetical protein
MLKKVPLQCSSVLPTTARRGGERFILHFPQYLQVQKGFETG